MEININGEIAMDIITTLKKMNVFDDILETGTKANDIQRKIDSVNAKILSKIDNYDSLDQSEKLEATQKVLMEDERLAKELAGFQNESEKLGGKLMSKLIMSLPTAKEDVWKVLAACTGKTKEEIKKAKLPELIKIIKEIIASDDVKELIAFFK